MPYKIEFQGEILSVQPRSNVWRYRLDNRTHSLTGFNLFLRGIAEGDEKMFSAAISGAQQEKNQFRIGDGKSKAAVVAGEKEVIMIALGYGKTQGAAHKGKTASNVSNMTSDSPAWFKQGIEAALLAPTAINQQKFRIELDGNRVTATSGFLGPCLKVDLGIVKCHFELGAGRDNFTWA